MPPSKSPSAGPLSVAEYTKALKALRVLERALSKMQGPSYYETYYEVDAASDYLANLRLVIEEYG